MAPKNDKSLKRPRDDKKKSKASSSSAPHEYIWNTHFKFLDEEQFNTFVAQFSQLTIITPRYLPYRYIESQGYDRVLEALHRGNWFDFLGQDVPFIQEDYIRIFYANMRRETLEDGSERTYTVVNDRELDISDETIHTVTNLSMRPTQRMDYNEVDFLMELGVPRFGNRRPTIAGMNPEFRFLLYLVHYLIFPKNTSRSHITQDDSFVMFNFLNNPNFNWCQLIRVRMWEIRENRDPLAYAPMIMTMLERAGFNTKVGTRTKKKATWEINERTFKNSSTPRANLPYPPNPPLLDQINVPRVHLNHVAHSLNAINFKLDSLRDSVDSMAQFMHDQFGYEIPPTRQRGTSSHFHDEDEDEDEEADDESDDDDGGDY